MKKTEISCVLEAKALLGEGTFWDPAAQCLWWVDIYANQIHRFDPRSGHTQTFATPHPPGCLAVRQSGGLVVAMGDGFFFFDPLSGEFRHVIDAESHLAETRMNDGKTDRQGRFWSGTVFDIPNQPSQAIGALYRLDPDLSCHKVIENVRCSNGLAWSPDSKTMYFTDSATPYVWAWDFDPTTAEIENRRVFIDLSSTNGAAVDGATVDADGCYWLTLPFKSLIQRYDPMGSLMDTIELPVDAPTCCEFGGESLDVLYVTTATLRRTPDELRGQPLAGGLFALRLGVKGLPASPFLG
jgi:L-arabinonolactonase